TESQSAELHHATLVGACRRKTCGGRRAGASSLACAAWVEHLVSASQRTHSRDPVGRLEDPLERSGLNRRSCDSAPGGPFGKLRVRISAAGSRSTSPRSRLPTPQRQILRFAQDFACGLPLHSRPRNGSTSTKHE